MSIRRPCVLSLSGHDPVGGAGIHADIEAIAAQGLHPLSVITALTVQDSRNVARVETVPPGLLSEQLARLEADCDIRAIKIGLLGDPAQVALAVALVARLGVPAVLDPVLRAGGGRELAGSSLESAIREQLVPNVSLLTPNAAEARRLAQVAPDADADACAPVLLARGCANLLITGGDEPGAQVRNTWYRPGVVPRRYSWPRLPETFHGAGCTLASAIAARLAAGDDMETAITSGQSWTQSTLERAIAVGHGRRIPGRH